MNPSAPGLSAHTRLPYKTFANDSRREMAWHRISFPMTDIGPHSNAMDFQQAFTRILFQTTEAWRYIVLVADREYAPKTYNYYASPGALDVARELILAHGGVACDRPNRRDVSLAVGDLNTLDRLLPKLRSNSTFPTSPFHL